MRVPWTRIATSAVTMAAIAFCTATPAPAEDDALEDIMEELTEALSLTAEQQPQVASHIREFAVALDGATGGSASDEAASDEAAEEGGSEDQSSGPAALTLVKEARKDFQDKMKKTLSGDQWKTFEATIDAMLQEMFEDLAGIVIVDLVPILELTEEQAEGLEPVIGTAMRGLIGVAVEYGDAKMNKRTKIKAGKALKKIKGNLDQGLAEVLTPEQITAYQLYKEAQTAAAEAAASDAATAEE